MEQQDLQKPKKKTRYPAKNPQRKVSPERYRRKLKKEGDEDVRLRVNGKPYAPENPNKANQWIPDPRRDVCWDIFLRSWMNGVPNAKQAALDAGYSETTSSNISSQTWFKDKFARLKRKDMLSKAERNLDKILDLDYSKLDELTGERTAIDIDKLKIVADISKMTATTLGKDEGYSSKSTIDQKVSGEVQIKAVSYADAIIEAPKQVEVIDVPAEEIDE